MARCSQCNKFVSFEEEEPEVDVEVDDEGHVSGTCRIVNSCAECGQELTEAMFDIDVDVELSEDVLKKIEAGASIEVEGDAERTSRAVGKGRGTKTFYGAEATFEVTVEGIEEPFEIKWSDEIQASAMDSLE